MVFWHKTLNEYLSLLSSSQDQPLPPIFIIIFVLTSPFTSPFLRFPFSLPPPQKSVAGSGGDGGASRIASAFTFCDFPISHHTLYSRHATPNRAHLPHSRRVFFFLHLLRSLLRFPARISKASAFTIFFKLNFLLMLISHIFLFSFDSFSAYPLR